MSFFLANLVLLFKNGAALIFANFLGILVVSFSAFSRGSSSRFVKIVLRGQISAIAADESSPVITRRR
jgi:hypothetical protein